MKTARSSLLANLTYLVCFVFSILILFVPARFPVQFISSPQSVSPLPNSKILLLALFVFALLLLFITGSLRRRQFLFRLTFLNWLLIIFAIFSTILCFISPASLDLLLPLAAFPLIILLIPSLISPQNSRTFISLFTAFNLAVAAFALLSLFAHLYPAAALFPASPNFLTPSLAPASALTQIISPLESTFILLLSLVTLAALYFKKGRFSQLFLIISLPCLILGLVASITTLIIQYNSEQLFLLSPQDSLQIALNTLENKSAASEQILSYQFPLEDVNSHLPSSVANFPAQPAPSSNLLSGHPSHNYADAFRQCQPRALLQNPALSQLVFTQGFGSLLTLVPVTGLACLLLFLTLFFQAWKLLLAAYSHPTSSATPTAQSFLLLLPLVTLVGFFILPLTPTTVFVASLIFSLVLSFNQPLFAQSRHLRPPQPILYLLLGSILLFSSWSLFKYCQIFQAQQLVQTSPANITQALKSAPQLDYLQRQAALTHFQTFQAETPPNSVFTNDFLPQSALDSLSAAQKATLLNPDNSQNWQVLGSIYQRLVPYSSEYLPLLQLSANAYLQALALNPYHLELYTTLIDLFLFQLHQAPTALNLLESLIELQPNSALAYQKLGQAHLATDNKTAAYQALQTALSLLDRQSPQYQQDFQAIQSQLLEINAR